MWHRLWLRWGFALCFFSVLYVVESGRSGESVQPDHTPSKGIWIQAVAAAAATAATNDAVGTLSVLLAGKSFSIWEDAPVPPQKDVSASDKASPIDPHLLAGVEDKLPVQSAADEAQAYNYLLVQANATPVAAFAKGARRDLTFAHLFEEPGKYRGQIVHIAGRLGRLRRFDAPRMAAEQGVPVLYEGWIFGDASFSNPYCVITTEVPASIPVGEALNHRVDFDGYFFKRYRYKAGDGWRDAPLLIGHALQDRQPIPSGTNSEAPVTNVLLAALLAVLATTVLLVVSLHWWFRRGDRRVRTHLDMTRNVNFVEPRPE
jgi:hypothetical protein